MATDGDKKDVEKGGTLEPTTGSSEYARKATARNHVDIITLIRSIQRAEGNPDCFLKGNADCDQLDCAWRPYCIGDQRVK